MQWSGSVLDQACSLCRTLYQTDHLDQTLTAVWQPPGTSPLTIYIALCSAQQVPVQFPPTSNTISYTPRPRTLCCS